MVNYRYYGKSLARPGKMQAEAGVQQNQTQSNKSLMDSEWREREIHMSRSTFGV